MGLIENQRQNKITEELKLLVYDIKRSSETPCKNVQMQHAIVAAQLLRVQLILQDIIERYHVPTETVNDA